MSDIQGSFPLQEHRDAAAQQPTSNIIMMLIAITSGNYTMDADIIKKVALEELDLRFKMIDDARKEQLAHDAAEYDRDKKS